MKSPANIFSFLSLLRIVEKANPDLLHTHSSIDSWLAGFVGKTLGIPIVRSRHISIPIKNIFPNNWLYSRIPEKIITSGEAISKVVTSVSGVKPENVKSISAGVDFRRFNFEIEGKKIRDELGVNPGQPLIGKIGVIRGWKGYQFLLEAVPLVLEKFPDCRFIFVGRGPGYEEILSTTKSRGLEKVITLLGHREDIPEIMAGLDIQVLASFAGEGTPQVIPQAFAMKTPLVATRVGSVPELLGQGERGVLVEPKNPSALAEGIIKLIENPELQKEISEKGYLFCKEELGIDRMVNETVALYEEVLNSFPH